MANNYQRPLIPAGNDFYLNIILTHFQEGGEIENFDLTKAKSIEVYLICSTHNTKIILPFEILDTPEHNVIKAFIDHRMLHNTSYGICVEGDYEDDLHWRWYMLPKEGLLIIPNTSGTNIPVEVEYVDVYGRVGFGTDLSDYYTKEETNTLLEAKADINSLATVATTGDYNDLENKPDLSIYAQSSNLSTVATSGDYNDLSNKPSIPAAQVNSDWNSNSGVSEILNKPDLSIYAQSSNLSTVATSGNYNDLSNKPSIPAAQVNSDWNSSSGVSEILNKPDLSIYATTTDLTGKQDTLVSGTNIKTINNQSLLGSGNIDIQGGGGTQVQSNWNETDTTDPSYIQNKPYVPYDSYSNILVQGYTGSSTITGNILSGSNSITGDLYNSILGGSGNIIGTRQFNNWNLNQNIMLGWQCSVDNVHTSLIIGENCDINTPASGALIIGQDNIVYSTSWHTDTRNREPIFILGKGNKMGYNTNASGWNIANKYMIGNYLTCEGDRDPGLYIGQYNKYLYYDQNNDPVYYPYDDALLTVGNGQLGAHLNAFILDEHNQLYIQPYNSTTNNDNIYEDVDGMINVAKQLASLTQHDYRQDYFTIVSLTDNNVIGWKARNANLLKTINVSTDDGTTWTSYTSSTTGTTLATLNTGDKLFIKGTNTTYGDISNDKYNYFTSTGNFNVEGNIMSLIYGDNFVNQTTLDSVGSNFVYLFYNCSKLVSSENLILPATTLTLACYSNMFKGCTSLTTAPVLPATILANDCYNSMFYGCTSLTTAPILSATTLATWCYGNMFRDCTSLNYIKCLATDISATSCTNKWVQNVAASGTFIKDDSMNSWTTGNNGIPNGWNVYNASQDVPAMKYEIPAAPVQSNWNESDSSSLAYIQNKPTIPDTTYMVQSSTTGMQIEVVSALPANPDSNTIYLII